MSDMSTYLSDVTATCTATGSDAILSVSPQNILVEEGDLNQVVRKMDDGTLVVTTLSANTFKITLQWTYLNSTDETTVYDFYHSSSKGYGREKSFYWYHPRIEKYFTVSFLGPMRKIYKANMPSGVEVAEVDLFVWGNKP